MRHLGLWFATVIFGLGIGIAIGPILLDGIRVVEPAQTASPASPEAQPYGGEPVAPPAVTLVESGLVNFDLSILNEGDAIPGQAGALDAFDGKLLVARHTDGKLVAYDPSTGAIAELPLVLPSMNVESLPERFPTGRRVRASDFRYNDILIVSAADGLHLFVTYNRYDDARSCFVMRLDEAILPADWMTADEATPVEWRVRFESTPCVAPSDDRNTFGGNQAGGRMALAPDGTLLFTTGDFEFDGLGRKVPPVSQDPASTLGRVMRLDLTSGSVTEVSRGHRNPQGLAIDEIGRVWVAEHAAMGGDELNLINPGGNYGWPQVTLGVLYTSGNSDAKSWPPNPVQGRHEGFEAPVFAWVPSIAPSALTIARGVHPRWEGDLLVATLAGQSLHRLRVEGTAVVYDERIPLPARVRDLHVLGGQIYLLFDDGRLASLTPHGMTDMTVGPFQTSAAIYEAGCVECHANPRAPRLAGIFGAAIGGQRGVVYSEPLSAKRGVWSRENLEAFLTAPNTFVRGTTMPDPQLDAATLKQVIDELEALRE